MHTISEFLLYKYNDSAHFLIYEFANFIGSLHLPSGWIAKDLYADLLTLKAILFLSSYLHPLFLNNLLIALSFFLTLLCALRLFRKIIGKNSNLFVVFSLFFSLSIFFLYRVTSVTPALYFVFIFPLLTYLLISKSNLLLIEFFILLSFLISNYYGFFALVLVVLWYFADLFLSKELSLKRVILLGKKLFIVVIPVLLFVIVFFTPQVINNLPVFGKYKVLSTEERISNVPRVYRPIESWYNLSFRPWYFFIPPKSSLFFGDLSKRLYKKIESTNYYLADDYMEEEMGGSYMGWHFLLGMGFVAVLLLLKKFKKKEYPIFKTVYENQEMIVRSFFIIFCILLISGPPSFTIRGITFYTPSYLLYYIVPVFRTLVRWAVVIYLFVLIINSYLVQDLYDLMKNTWQKVLFIVVFLSLNFVIFAIKIPVINVSKPPLEISYLKERYPDSVPYAVYPKGDYYSIFWIISHEDLLINPVNFVNYETGFNSNEFSKNLITEEGIKEFLSFNPRYLLYYEESISDEDLISISSINPKITSKKGIVEFFERNVGLGRRIDGVYVFGVFDR